MTKKCRSCQSRTIGTGNPGSGPFAEDAQYAKSVDLCRPCATEAGWENMHADGEHDTESCWECHPELNRAGFDPNAAARAGTSRAGMRMTVPVRASGLDKANAVADRIRERFAVQISKPTKRNGQVTRLVLDNAGDFSLDLRWDAAGRFLYGPSTANGKKVRNVSGALRAIGF